MNGKPKLSKPVPIEVDPCDFSDDECKIVPASPASSQVRKKRKTTDESVLDGEIAVLRQTLLASRRFGASRNPVDIKHVYFFPSGVLDGTNFLPITTNRVALGATFNGRVGNAIFNHGLTIRAAIRYVPTQNGLVSANWAPPLVRVIVYRDFVPSAIPPGITQVIEYTTGVPTSSQTVYTSLGGTSPQGNMTAFRNPLTFDRYHVFLDEVIKPHDTAWSQGGIQSLSIGAMHWERHIKLHNSKTTFSASTAASIVTNCINVVVLSDVVTATSPAYVSYEATFDQTFSDAPEV